ncbi:hypothetical protein P5705_03890 [Pseudomonas entomophila]|uniref:hypothetical protein n=1 Tax=Pseudomonas entomophila TaxID=312306 RepID=UPI002404BBE5|nr:hypothetical protein [Pseudomonas entomophila]MDF9616774.1 hypothetical protein [Pseudomonas entomophila]
MLDQYYYSKADELEELAIDKRVSASHLAAWYADFLIVMHDRLMVLTPNHIVMNDVRARIEALRLAGVDNIDKEQRDSSLVMLWRVHDTKKAEDEVLAAYARAAICCFAGDKEWEESNADSETPIYYLFLYLVVFGSEALDRFYDFLKNKIACF